MSIKVRYLIFFMVAALVPLLVTVFYFVNDAQKRAHEDIVAQLETLAKLKQKTMHDHLVTIGHDTAAITKNTQVVQTMKDYYANGSKLDENSPTAKRAFELIRLYQEGLWGQVHHVFLVNTDAEVVLSPPHGNSKGSHLHHHITHKDFKKALEGEELVTDFFGFEEKTHFHQLYMQPVKDEGGKVLGVLVVEIVIDYQNKLLSSEFKLGKTGKIFMTTMDGQRIVNNKPDLKPALKGAGIFRAMEEGKTVGEFLNDEGTPVLGLYFHKINKYPWVLSIEIDKSEVFAPVDKIRNYAFMMIAIVAGVMFIFSFVVAKKFSAPILQADSFSKKIAKGDLSESPENQVFRDRPDELGSLHKSLETMRLSLKDLIDNLDAKVKEKTREVSLILKHIPTGLLTFEMEGTVGKEYSAKSELFFGKKIGSEKVESVLFKDKKNQGDFKGWLDFLPLSPMPFEDSAGLAPTDVSIQSEEGNYELLLDFVPIYKEGSDSEYEKIMLIAKDVTEEKELQREMQRKEEKTEFILKVLKSKDGYINFLKECGRCVDELFETSDHLNSIDEVTAAFRLAHTIKGNSSAYGASSVRDAADGLETELMKGRDGEVEITEAYAEQVKSFLKPLLKSFNEHIKETENLFGEVFDPKADVEKEFSLKESQVNALLDLVNNNGEKASLLKSIENIKLKEINVFLLPYVDQVSALAERLEKQVKPLNIIGGEILVDTDILNPLFAAFVHMIRNSVDHGIETMDERTESGKEEFASISIDVKEVSEGLVIVVEDDGKGIRPDVISKIALSKGLKTEAEIGAMSESEIQLLVFAAGFSTKTEVTSTSGRGVGMDAVKHEVEKLGGKIGLESIVGQGSKFILTLPIYEKEVEASDVENKRLLIREELSPYVEAMYSDSSPAGKVIDLNADGLLLLSDKEHEVGDQFILSLSMDGLDEKMTSLDLEVEVKRSKKSLDQYEIGFQMVGNLSEPSQLLLRKILRVFST